jgi:RNA polymerase sigma-70 factor (ECF subfamily)
MSASHASIPEGDADLMLRVQADDAEAFGLLYDRFSSRAYRVAYGATHDRPRAEDIVHDAFFSLWRRRADYRPELGTVTAWVMAAVRHRSIEAAKLRDSLARLPAAERDVIALAFFGELSAAEIAQELTLPLGTVKGRMRLGLEKLNDGSDDAVSP